MRPSFAGLAVAAAALSLLTPGRTANRRVPNLVVKKLTVRPGLSVPGSGAQLTLTVQFAKPTPQITQVVAFGYVPATGSGPGYTLTDVGGGVFQGSCRMPV